MKHENVRSGQPCAMMILFLTVTLVAPALAQDSSNGMPPARESWRLIEVHAVVGKIDSEKQEVTLKGPDGNKVTLNAANVAERLDTLKVGDRVRTKYWTFMRAEFREPTSEEKKSPFLDLTGTGSVPEEEKLPGDVGIVVKAVVTVTAVDRKGKQVTIRGPRGKFLTLPAQDERILRNLQVGQVVIMTYAEAVALSLDNE